MISLQQRIAVITDMKANLVAQLRELDRLREQVRKALLERFSVDVNRNNKGVPRSAQIRFELL